MAEALPRNLAYGTIAMVFIIVGGIALMSIFSSNNPSMLDNQTNYTDFQDTFNKYDELSTSMNQLEADTDINLEDATLLEKFGFWDNLIQKSWNTLKALGSTFGFVGDIFTGLNKIFGIPAWIGNLMWFSVIALIVFAIFTVIFRWQI